MMMYVSEESCCDLNAHQLHSYTSNSIQPLNKLCHIILYMAANTIQCHTYCPKIVFNWQLSMHPILTRDDFILST